MLWVRKVSGAASSNFPTDTGANFGRRRLWVFKISNLPINFFKMSDIAVNFEFLDEILLSRGRHSESQKFTEGGGNCRPHHDPPWP